MLVLSVPIYLHELFENRCLATIASLCKLGRVMVVAVDTTLVLVVAIRSAENCGTDGACKMFDVVFSIQRSDI